jgi:hypothetical protein
VVVGAIESAPRECGFDPAEQRLVIGVHPKGYVRLASVAAEVTFADEHAD